MSRWYVDTKRWEISKVMASQSSLREGLAEEQIKKVIKEEVKSEIKEVKNALEELKRMIPLLVQIANGSNAN